jgi:hypothetical protein
MLQITHDNFFLQHTYVANVLYILERPSSWSTSRIHPSWPQSRVELRLLLPCLMSILLVCLGPPSILVIAPTTHPSLLAGQLNTNIQVNNAANAHFGTHIHISTSHSCYYSFSSLHFFHSLGQDGWLRLFPSDTSGIQYYISISSRKSPLELFFYCLSASSFILLRIQRQPKRMQYKVRF